MLRSHCTRDWRKSGHSQFVCARRKSLPWCVLVFLVNGKDWVDCPFRRNERKRQSRNIAFTIKPLANTFRCKVSTGTDLELLKKMGVHDLIELVKGSNLVYSWERINSCIWRQLLSLVNSLLTSGASVVKSKHVTLNFHRPFAGGRQDIFDIVASLKLESLRLETLAWCPDWGKSGPEVIKLFFMFNSAEHEIFSANK